MSDVTVFIADPPWAWSGGKKKAPKYSTMKLKELCDLAPAVKAMQGRDNLMLMWATAPTLQQAMALMATWGFAYKSFLIWRKRKLGTGFYSRNNAEIVLIGRKGRPGCPQKGEQGLTIFDGEARDARHSSKPHELHEWVERHYADARKIELFARVNRDGWNCFGFDVGSAITPTGIVPVTTRTGLHQNAEETGSCEQRAQGCVDQGVGRCGRTVRRQDGERRNRCPERDHTRNGGADASCEPQGAAAE